MKSEEPSAEFWISEVFFSEKDCVDPWRKDHGKRKLQKIRKRRKIEFDSSEEDIVVMGNDYYGKLLYGIWIWSN